MSISPLAASSAITHSEMSDQDRGRAVINAATRGDEAAITTLLANGPISHLDRGHAVAYAALCGNSVIVAALLANGEISNQDREDAAGNATEGGYPATLAILLANGEISDERRVWAVNRASMRQFSTLSMALPACGPIADQHRGAAGECATPHEYSKVLKVLEKYRSCEEQCNAIQTAIQAGSVHVTTDLLAATSLMSWQTLKLLTTAIHSKNLESMEVILKSNCYIRPHDFGTALARAAASDDADVTHRIFDIAFNSKRFFKPLFLEKFMNTFPTETALRLLSRSSHNKQK